MRAQLILISGVIATIVALLGALYRINSELAYGRHPNARGQIFNELVGAYTAAAILLAILPLIQRLRIRRSNALRVLPAHAALLLGYSAVHTLAMWLVRAPLYPYLGFGTYKYGTLPERFVMELSADVMVYTVFVSVAHVVWGYADSRQREEQLVRAQLDALRSQLQPHFLFNSLNAISNLIYEDPRRADEMIGRLSELLRRTLQLPSVVPLSEELRTTEMYLDMMQLRFEDKLTVEIDAGRGPADSPVPHLLLQPLVENCLKHGAGDQSIDIRVRARRADGRLHLIVEDSGRGLRGRSEGVGLRNTRERLDKLFGKGAAFRISGGANGGCVCEIEIPCAH